MKKKFKRFEVDFYLQWEDGVKISKIREDLDTLEKLGANYVDVDIDSSCSGGYPYVSIDAYIYREETDKEFENRVAETKSREQLDTDRDIAEFERLKLKLNK